MTSAPVELGQEQQEPAGRGRDVRRERGDLRLEPLGRLRPADRRPAAPRGRPCALPSHRTGVRIVRKRVGQQPGLGRFRGTVSTGPDARMTAVPTDDLFDRCSVRVLVGDRGGVARPHRRGLPARRRGEGRRARGRDRASGQGARQPPHRARPPRPRRRAPGAHDDLRGRHVDDLVAAWEVIAAGLAPHRPPSTLLGVSVLGYPDQLVEIDGIAARPESGGD